MTFHSGWRPPPYKWKANRATIVHVLRTSRCPHATAWKAASNKYDRIRLVITFKYATCRLDVCATSILFFPPSQLRPPVRCWWRACQSRIIQSIEVELPGPFRYATLNLGHRHLGVAKQHLLAVLHWRVHHNSDVTDGFYRAALRNAKYSLQSGPRFAPLHGSGELRELFHLCFGPKLRHLWPGHRPALAAVLPSDGCHTKGILR